ncbi:calcium-binding protein [Rhizobium sp. FKL33]|uniref:calcium-binding protein n=1 Tax=Rhizobium sp. FKL33 TaxID=2562307 RepID=UPI001484FB9E|nr:calcium-binding protein [Rhizobium sp. FKL33]
MSKKIIKMTNEQELFVAKLEAIDPQYEIYGNALDQTIMSGLSDDKIFGYGGDDTIIYRYGNDTIYGGEGDDKIAFGETSFAKDWFAELFEKIYVDPFRPTSLTAFGEEGNDEIGGGRGADYLDGGLGNDTLFGGGGADRLFGGTGDDELDGGLDLGDEADLLNGGSGDDIYINVQKYDKVIDNAGDDEIRYMNVGSITIQNGIETVRSNQASNSWYSSAVITGNDENNKIFGSHLSDKIIGLKGNDTIRGENGNDDISGNQGKDDLAGGLGNDRLYGDSESDTIDGEWGDDIIYGGTGDDKMTGGEGTDTLTGDTGSDLYVIDDLDKVIETAEGGYDKVEVTGTTYSLATNVEEFVVTAKGAKMEIFGNGSDNIVTIANELPSEPDSYSVHAGAGNDTVTGGFGDDLIWGGSGDDVIMGGGRGNDRLLGEAGNDKLYGSEWSDIIAGGAGQDRMEGLGGKDIFVFNAISDSTTSASDKIVGWEFGSDKIDLSAIDADTTKVGNQAFNFFGSLKPIFGSAGDLWAEVSGAAIKIKGDVNGDGAADFQAVIYDSEIYAKSLTASDFVL